MANQELTFNQIFTGLNFRIERKSNFCIIFEKNKHFFGVYSPVKNGAVRCVYLNESVSLNPFEIIPIATFYTSFNNFKLYNELPTTEEFPPFSREVSQENLIKYFLGLIPLENFSPDESTDMAFDNFTSEVYTNIYGKSNKKELAAILKNERFEYFDLLDFNDNLFQKRLSFDLPFWNSQYYSNMVNAVVTVNPSNLSKFFSDYSKNLTTDFFSVILNENLNPILSFDVYSLLTDKPFTKVYLLYQINIDELKPLCYLVTSFYNYINKGILNVLFTDNSFYITFSVKPNEDITNLLQFDSNINSLYNSLSGMDEQYSPNIKEIASFTSYKTESKTTKQLHLTSPLKCEALLSFIMEIIKFGKLNFEPVKTQ